MAKTILITGATDGIGLEAAKLLASDGHRLLIHGRNTAKLDAARDVIGGKTHLYLADLSRHADIVAMVAAIRKNHVHLDVVINNAGVLKASETVTSEGIDIRFMVNAIAPLMLTKALLPLMGATGRVINLSSAAQATVDLNALMGDAELADMAAYAQSKLAMTMWSGALAATLLDGPSFLAVNPGSLLDTKMVKEGFGIVGNDLAIGAQILRRVAVDPDFADVSGRYYDNDAGGFGQPHPDALDPDKIAPVVAAIEAVIERLIKG